MSLKQVIVVGTGLEESIVAAAAARNGHTVLHIDSNDFYGGQWSAFTLDGIQKWIEEQQRGHDLDETHPGEDLSPFLKEGESLVRVGKLTTSSTFSGVKQKWFVPAKSQPQAADPEEVQDGKEGEERDLGGGLEAEEVPKKAESSSKGSVDQESILSLAKRYSLDLMPHLLFSRGSMVELLIKSNISRYTEFKSVSRVLTVLNGILEHVPSSRSDVFTTKHISVIEKRILMKFINFCVNYDATPEVFEAFRDKTFHEFLRHEKLTPNLIHFVLNSIAMVGKDTGCIDGLAATQKFLLSLGRFGNSPFLWPMYGSGELPQAFCRLCAVFGGVYYLDRQIDAIVVDKDGSVAAILSRGQRIDCKYLLVNSKLCPDELKGDFANETVSRKICLLSDTVMASDSGEPLSFLSLGPDVTRSKDFAFAQEVGYSGAVTPRGIFCLHLTTRFDETRDGVDNCLEILVPDKEKLIWSLDFESHTEIFADAASSSRLSNLFLTSGPTFELDFDSTIDRARKLFLLIFGDEEFLPRAPEPEEIILGGDDDPQQPEATTGVVQSEEETSVEAAKVGDATGSTEAIGQQGEED